MPIYGYQCQDCGHTLDALQKISDDPLLDCPECGAPSLKRQLSAPRFRLKGQGWYETDFKKDNQRNLVDGKSADGKSDAKSGDSKPAKDSQSSKPSKSSNDAATS